MKNMKKIISLILTLGLLLGLVVPISANAEDYPLYVMPCSGTFDAAVVKGDSLVLPFVLMRSAPSRSDRLILEFYKGTAEELMSSTDPVLVETRDYPVTVFDHEGLGVTWAADSRYSVGDYCVVGILVNEDGYIYEQIEYIADLNVVSTPCEANDMDLAIFDSDYYFDYDFDYVVPYGKPVTLTAYLLPVVNTTKQREFYFSGYDATILGVSDVGTHGFNQVIGLRAGTTELTVNFGSLKKTFYISVEMDGLHMDLSPTKATLCPGQTDIPKVSYLCDSMPNGIVPESYLAPEWFSSDESVVTVENGVVTAVGPGTAGVYVAAGTAWQYADYTVQPHKLPADSTMVPNTATQYGYQEGKCSVCGAENARNTIAPIFTDTAPNAWYASYVDFVYENGIMNGTSEDTFAPNMPMSRAMVATVLYRVAGSPKSEGEIPFSDTVEGSWYADAVRWAAGEGIVNGFTDGTFRPELDITREQFATILYRYSKNAGMDMSATADLSVFPDAGNTSAFAVEAMRWAVGTGLITGVASGGRTELRPLDNATRVQFATVISRYMAMNEDIATKTKTLGDFEYCALPDGTVRLCGYLGSDEAPEIPAEIDGKPVTAIAKSAFAGNLTVKTLEIPENVTKIGDYAFECCPALESVSFPASLREVGMGAFSGCVKLATVEVSEGVEKFGDGAFFFCKKLSDFAFPGSVCEVGDYMFAECSSLSKVTFKEGLPEVSERMFWGCASLRSAMLPESVKSIGALAFAKCEMLSEFAIPAGVTEVGAYAFDGCGSLRSVTFPAKVLREATFRSCYGLESFTLGEGVETIEEGAFRGASFEGEFAIPASVTTIAPGAFNSFNAAGYNVAEKNPNYSSLDGVLFSKDMTKLLAYPAGRFEEHYEIPASVTTIGSYAFAGVFFLSELELPATVTTLEDDAFYLLVNLEEFTVPATVTSMGKRVFENMNARTVTLKNDLKTLPEGTFLNSNSENVILPDGLESIGPDAFLCANGLIELTLPKGLREIADGALLGTSCTFVSESPNFKAEGYQLLSADGKTLYSFRTFEEDAVIPAGVERIAPYAVNCLGLSSVTVPDSLKSVGESGLGCRFLNNGVEVSIDPVVGLKVFGSADSPIRAWCAEHNLGFFTAEPEQNMTEVTLAGDETAEFVIKNAALEDVSFSSFDSDVVSVTQDGIITAHKKGQADVFANVGTTYFKCTVTVTSDGTPNPAAFDASPYQDLSEDEVEAWLTDYLKVNEGRIALDHDSNPYSSAYKSENYFEGIWAAQVDESPYDAGAEDLFGVGFRPQLRMMGHGLATELSRYENNGSLVLYSGTDDFGRFIGKPATVKNLKESIGTVIEEPYFLSTALQESVTPTFGGPYCSVLVIYADEEAIDGGYIEAPVGQGVGGEYELLMKGGARMEIIDAGIREITVKDEWMGFESTIHETYLKLRLLPKE